MTTKRTLDIDGGVVSRAGWIKKSSLTLMALSLHFARVWHALVLGVLLGLAGPAWADPPITGTVELDGGTIGSGEGPRDDSATYTDRYKVTVAYSIATKTVDGKKVFDPANSKIVMKDSKYNWSTLEIPLSDVKGDPTTGKVTGLTFDAPKWYTNPGPDGVVDKGIKGSITFDAGRPGKAKGTITAKYEDNTGTTKSNYTFTTDPQRPGGAKGGKAATKIDEKKSLDFDAATRVLSVHDDTVVGTPSPGDPILGAALSFPDFSFAGFNAPLGLAVFWAIGDTPMTMARGADVFQRSAIPLLFYDLADNLFYARLAETTLAGMSPGSPFYDPSLASLSSPFLDELASALDPASADFDPLAGLFMTITPDANFAALTARFSISAHTGATDEHFVSSVPEPSALSLFAVGLAVLSGVALCRKRRKGDI